MDATAKTSSVTQRVPVSVAVTVLRAVPCAKHESYVSDCPDCLTGEQAELTGIHTQRERLGVVSDSSWRWFSVARWRAWWRIRRANRSVRR